VAGRGRARGVGVANLGAPPRRARAAVAAVGRAVKWLVIVALAACAGVLGLGPGEPQPFPHRRHALAGVTCTRCHDAAAPRVPDTASCTTCHAKPHDARPCLTCHAAAGALDELAQARDHLRFDHRQHAGATRDNCMRCHVGVAEGDRAMRPPMATCFRCHDSTTRTCDKCHRDLEDAQLLPQTHLAHDGDWLHAHGARAASSADACQSCHRERFCASCHGVTAGVLPATVQFSDPFAPSVHRAGFAARHALEARAEPGACATCHTPDRCVGCHQSRGVAGDNRRSPHPANWVGLVAGDDAHGRAARRDPAACAACHDGAGQALCVRCHAVGGVGGNPHPSGWSSRLPRSAMPCRLCHPLGTSR